MRLTLPLAREAQKGPPKPAKWEPCNGCGLCCAAEVCLLGKRVYGENAPAPCQGMTFVEGRFLCKVVIEAEEVGFGPAIGLFLGVGIGCDSNDMEVPDADC